MPKAKGKKAQGEPITIKQVDASKKAKKEEKTKSTEESKEEESKAEVSETPKTQT